MTTAQVVETSVTVNNNSPIQDYVHPDDQTQPTFIKHSFVHFYFYAHESCFIQFGRIIVHETEQQADNLFSFLPVLLRNCSINNV